MIKLLQTIEWSKTCWDESWREKVVVEDILPKVGGEYEITLDNSEKYTEEGKVYSLWKPPHSELNGWYDKRPSEILKSYVIEGILRKDNKNEHKFYFTVEKFTLLTSFFQGAEDTCNSPLPIRGLDNGTTSILWENAKQIVKTNIGSYIYIAAQECETQLEAIFITVQSKMYLIYSSSDGSQNSEAIIVRYCLKDNEQRLFDGLFTNAKKLDEGGEGHLKENEVWGAEYM